MNISNLLMRKAWQTKFAKLGKINLRQSSIRKFRYCPKQYHYDTISTDDDSYAKPVYFTLGSYVHQYIEEYSNGLKPEPERILMECFEKDVKVDADFNDLLWRIDNKEIFYGMSLNDLAVKTCVYLDTMGFEPERIEKKEHMQLGALSITGTPDLVSVNRLTGERYVLDIKTSGLWKRFMGSGSLSAVSYKEAQITFATQLQHYDWMLYRLHGIKADRYGYVCPVNFIPVTTGKNAGKLRGEPISIAPAATLEQLTEIYEYDLFGTAKEIARCIESNDWPRSRPETYGKLDCVTCRHRDKCLGQRELSVKMPSFIDEDLG